MTHETPHQDSPESANESENQRQWRTKLAEVKERVDRAGGEMEPGIIEAVTALNLHKFPTSMSCEGHLESGKRPYPWVSIEALDRPDDHYIDETKIKQAIADKYQIGVDDLWLDEHNDAYQEATALYEANGETEEFKRWREQNSELKKQMELLIAEYRQHVGTIDNQYFVRLKPVGIHESFDVHTGGPLAESQADSLERTPEALQKRQQAMQDFTEFLKRKYFET